VARSTARLLQSLSDAAALQAALPGALGVALSAPFLGGLVNPAAGRRPDASKLVYAGGSLGGTLGYVHALADPSLHAAVLNVPGAAWTHFVPASSLWETLSLVFHGTTPSPLDQALAWPSRRELDPIDGAAWSTFTHRDDTLFLEQESLGDPILPTSVATWWARLPARCSSARCWCPWRASRRRPARAPDGFTQFRVPPTSPASTAFTASRRQLSGGRGGAAADLRLHHFGLGRPAHHHGAEAVRPARQRKLRLLRPVTCRARRSLASPARGWIELWLAASGGQG